MQRGRPVEKRTGLQPCADSSHVHRELFLVRGGRPAIQIRVRDSNSKTQKSSNPAYKLFQTEHTEDCETTFKKSAAAVDELIAINPSSCTLGRCNRGMGISCHFEKSPAATVAHRALTIGLSFPTVSRGHHALVSRLLFPASTAGCHASPLPPPPPQAAISGVVRGRAATPQEQQQTVRDLLAHYVFPSTPPFYKASRFLRVH